MSSSIRVADQSELVRADQRNLNARLRAHGNAPIRVSGRCDAARIRQSAFAAGFLGALLSTVNDVLGGETSVGVQRMVADPNNREPARRRPARERRGKDSPRTKHILVQAGHPARAASEALCRTFSFTLAR